MAATTPTAITYINFDDAYRHFNRELFGDALPACLITLQRKSNAYGYFCGSIFKASDTGAFTDEIAMNPQTFEERTETQTLGTLAHEMVHLWQLHFGKPSRSGYHNKEWAAKMREIGLIPTDTGAPGGKETGQRVTHMIEEGGPFALSCARLLDRGSIVAYVERTFRAPTSPGTEGGEGDDEEGNERAKAKKAKRASKTKFSCPCGKNAWGKPDLSLICGECGAAFTPDETDDA